MNNSENLNELSAQARLDKAVSLQRDVMLFEAIYDNLIKIARRDFLISEFNKSCAALDIIDARDKLKDHLSQNVAKTTLAIFEKYRKENTNKRFEAAKALYKEFPEEFKGLEMVIRNSNNWDLCRQQIEESIKIEDSLKKMRQVINTASQLGADIIGFSEDSKHQRMKPDGTKESIEETIHRVTEDFRHVLEKVDATDSEK